MPSATWLAASRTFYIAPNGILPTNTLGVELTPLGQRLYITTHSISLTVNAVVMSLIVLKILGVYRFVTPTPKDQTLGIGRAEAKLRSIIFIIIESGMAMFTIQSIRIIFMVLGNDALYLITFTGQMISVIIGSVISSFHFSEIFFRD